LLGVRVVATVAQVARYTCQPAGRVERVRGEFLAARARGEFAQLAAATEDRCARLLDQARVEARRSKSGRPDVLQVRCVQ
jgi:hypothetical protein